MLYEKVRESSFELVRLIAMWMIVIYHQYYRHIQPAFETPFNQEIWLPLHIGVPLFVLISGYWGIHISGKGLARLLGQMLIYTAILTIAYDYLTNGGYRPVINNLMLVSKSPRWFMRTYICLYLFSPVINKYLCNITTKQRVYLLLSLLFISVYIGTFGNDPSLSDGKNLANFLTLYVIGNTLHAYEKFWKKIPVYYIITVYLLINISVVSVYNLFYGTFVAKGIWKIFFPYQSPGLILNSILFFLIVLHWRFKSKAINWFASSALAIYLIHESSLVRNYILGPVTLEIREYLGNDYLTLPAIIFMALVLCFVCILLDKLLSPLWRCFARIGDVVENKLKTKMNKWWE